MFKIVEERTFTHRVEVQVPVDGGFQKQDFKATFRALDPSVVEEFDMGRSDGQSEFLRAVIVSLDDIADDQGAPQPYNDALRDQVIKLPYARLPLVQAYFGAVGKAKKGN